MCVSLCGAAGQNKHERERKIGNGGGGFRVYEVVDRSKRDNGRFKIHKKKKKERIIYWRLDIGGTPGMLVH